MWEEQEENNFEIPVTHLTKLIQEIDYRVTNPLTNYPFRMLVFGRFIDIYAPIHPHAVVIFAYQNAGFFQYN